MQNAKAFNFIKIIISLILCISFLIGCRSDVAKEESYFYTSDFTSDVWHEDTEVSVGELVSENASSETEISSDTTVSVMLPQSKPQAPKPEIKPVEQQAQNNVEMRAVWISFLEYQKILKGKTEKQFTDSVKEYFNNCVEFGFNTVIVHARSHGDAYYKSKYFPTSVNFTEKRQKTAPFDPLKIMVTEAKKRRLRIEAWVNPYRGNKPEWEFAENDVIKSFFDEGKAFRWIDSGTEYYYLNPAEPSVRELVLNGVIELVENYDIDGIHFDDYFYPTQDESIDKVQHQKYSNGKSLEEFRRDCVNKLISSVYKEIKKRKNITFGISPAGNIESCMTLHYADVRLWGSTAGYVDYLAPQIYWDYNQKPLSFEAALEDWKKAVSHNKVKLSIGLAAYKIGNGFSDAGDVLKRQILDTRKAVNYGGFIMFRYENFFSPVLGTERENIKTILK